MKVTIEFNLPEENEEYAISSQAINMHSALFDLLYNTRKKIVRMIESAEDQDKNVNAYDTIDFFYDEIHRILDEHGVKMQ